MKIKALSVCADGKVHVENIPPYKRAIEFRDGVKPFLPEGVYFDIDRKGPPLIVYWHGVPLPEGVTLSREDQVALLKESFHQVQHRLKPPISSFWVRVTIKWFVYFVKAVTLGTAVAFVILILMTLVMRL